MQGANGVVCVCDNYPQLAETRTVQIHALWKGVTPAQGKSSALWAERVYSPIAQQFLVTVVCMLGDNFQASGVYGLETI